MKKRILLLSVFALAIASCSKNDDKPSPDVPNPNEKPQPESVSEGGVFKPSVGGPNEPNQVFIDLSAKKKVLQREILGILVSIVEMTLELYSTAL